MMPLFNIGCAGFGQSRARRIAAGEKIRLGMIGTDYKHTRKVLLRNLTGSSAFRHGTPDMTEGGADDAVSE